MYRSSEKNYTYGFVIPALLIYSVIFVLPAVFGVYYSLTDWNISRTNINFIGLKNYESIILDKGLRKVIANTLVYAVTVSFKNLFGLLLAVAVNVKMVLEIISEASSFCHVCIHYCNWLGLYLLASERNTEFVSSKDRPWILDNWLVGPKKLCFSIAEYLSGNGRVIIWLFILPVSRVYQVLTMKPRKMVQMLSKILQIYLPLLVPSININLILSLIEVLKYSVNRMR